MRDDFFLGYFDVVHGCVASVDAAMLIDAAERIKRASASGRKVMLVGNGGSAAMASHVAVDLTKAAGIKAVNFNEADLLTCFANDYGYEHVFAKAVEFYGDKGDLLVAISSSGNSQNIVNAARYAMGAGMDIITFSGFKADNQLCTSGQLNFWVDSCAYNVVEVTHQIWLLSIVDFLVGRIDYPAS